MPRSLEEGFDLRHRRQPPPGLDLQEEAGFDNMKATFYKNLDAFGRAKRVQRPDGQEIGYNFYGDRNGAVPGGEKTARPGLWLG